MARHRLFLDLETRSCADLRKVGVYRYAQDISTDVVLAAYAIGTAKPKLWRRDQPLPAELEDALRDPALQISAHNFTFERLMLTHCLAPIYGWPDVPMQRWDCTMARARAAGMPGGLEAALAACGSKTAKDFVGHALMLRMCRPRRFDNHGRPVWWEDEERMARLGLYCMRDVEGSQALDRALPELSDEEREIWLATEEINDRGVRFDLDFCRTALVVANEERQTLDRRMGSVTGGQVRAASNVAGLKAWLPERGVQLLEPLEEDEEPDTAEDEEEEGNRPPPGLRRNDVQRILLRPDLPADVREALQIRLDASKVSTKKLDSILHRAEDDGRVRGLLGYHGANTGRYAATGGVQIHNFPRDGVADWVGIYQGMLAGDYAPLRATGLSVLEVISRMLRGAIVPEEGHELLAADYSSVEAVGVAWLAGCAPLVAAFAAKRPIYEEMGARVFGLHPAEVTKDSLARFVGKTLVLGAGYGMGWSKFAATCAAQGRLVPDALAQRGITTYRDTYPEIPLLWRRMERCAIQAVRDRGQVQRVNEKVAFLANGENLRMQLPSGRTIRYRKPRLEYDERFGSQKLVYDGVNPKTKRWGEQSTYGGRLTENAVQGLCRDLMVGGMMRLRAAGYAVTTSVHDEILAEIRRGSNEHSIDHARELMCELPAWARGFPLRAEGKAGERYSK